MRSTPTAPALLVLALLAGASACGGSDDADPSGSPTSASSASGSPSPADPSSEPSSPTSPTSTAPTSSASPSAGSGSGVPSFPADTRPDDGGLGSGNGLTLTGVRVGRQDGFDRVVLDLGGSGTPGWRVEYVDRPRQDGSGDPVALRGSSFLQVVVRGVGMPFDTGVEQYGDASTRVSGAGTEGIAEIAPGSSFEGDQQAFIGLVGPRRPFRAFALEDPTRVVVDVAHR